MTTIQVHTASAADTAAALDQLDHQLAQRLDRTAAPLPQLIVAFYGCEHDDALLHRHLAARFPGVPLLGGSSSGGLMTQHGLADQQAIGLMLLDDAGGDYGVAAAPLGSDAAHTAERLLLQALASCGCSGELPELIWVYQEPGREEAVIEGLRRIVGDRCPIVGGSAGDNAVNGRWRQLGTEGPLDDGLVVGVLFPSTPIGCAFQGGYEPAGPSGIVTGIGGAAAGPDGVVAASAGREILSIDGEPASAVYDGWIGGRIADQLERGGAILAATTMCPLATDAGRVDGVSHYLLVHPESVTADGALRTFCNVEVGARVYAMTGDRDQLVDRAGRVTAQALDKLPPAQSTAAGALVVFCGGCKMAVGDDIGKVAGAVAASLGDAPFIGCFTFGEQGRLMDRNVHGNLMISAVVFAQ